MHSSDVGHQVDRIRVQEQEWSTREQEYRKRIQQLEAKVGGQWKGTLCPQWCMYMSLAEGYI